MPVTSSVYTFGKWIIEIKSLPNVEGKTNVLRDNHDFVDKVYSLLGC